MPQLDFATYASQLFWLVLTFVPLYLIIYKVALPRIGEVLEARQHKIDDDLKKAAARKQEAEAVLAEYEALQADSHARAQALLRDAQEAMAEDAAKSNSALGEKLAQEGDEAEARIATAKETALGNLNATVIEVATAATEKLIGTAPSTSQVEAAVAAAGAGKE